MAIGKGIYSVSRDNSSLSLSRDWQQGDAKTIFAKNLQSFGVTRRVCNNTSPGVQKGERTIA